MDKILFPVRLAGSVLLLECRDFQRVNILAISGERVFADECAPVLMNGRIIFPQIGECYQSAHYDEIFQYFANRRIIYPRFPGVYCSVKSQIAVGPEFVEIYQNNVRVAATSLATAAFSWHGTRLALTSGNHQRVVDFGETDTGNVVLQVMLYYLKNDVSRPEIESQQNYHFTSESDVEDAACVVECDSVPQAQEDRPQTSPQRAHGGQPQPEIHEEQWENEKDEETAEQEAEHATTKRHSSQANE